MEREAEQEKLDAEMEKRRKRIQAWQEQRRKEEAAAAGEGDANGGADGDDDSGKKQKAWTLEDESSDDDEEGAGGSGDEEMAEADDGGLKAPPPAAAAAEEEEEEVDPLDAFMQANVLPSVKQQQRQEAATAPAAAAAAAAAQEEDEVDPLDAFMQASVLPAVHQLEQQAQQLELQQQQQQATAAVPAPAGPAAKAAAGEVAAAGDAAGAVAEPAAAAAAPAVNGEATSKPVRQQKRRSRYDTESSEEEADSSDAEEEEEEDEAEWMRKLIAGKLSKGDKLLAVDHAAMNYPPFRRNFYSEVPELARMTPAEVDEYRRQLDGVKTRGKDVPKPVKNWHQCGLNSRILDILRKGGFERPLAIQAQALPVIMSGRDCIGIAKTGSGKTLAFVLPMLRHVKDQPALAQGDGPVALCMAPTRELVTQIGKEIKRFAKAVALTCVCVYGGSGVANQISELKRGTEIVVCTPGRMIDLLATGAGRITNLRRVTYLVMDEADRMFDMGFEPQIMRMVQNVRPDRQTVMFSATFPRQVEVLARQVLNNPVEIQVGGRSVVNKDITQFVEIRPEEDRFLRLLEVLGEWYEKGKLLLFVSSQDRCDTLFRDLLRAGYPCLSLHGGKDQSDRESTTSDFKANVCNILVATSVAARGLDVKDLVLVVNYDVPNHHEDYVHRVGRTGRAGAKGTAITFIAPDEEQYSPDLVKALKESNANIPQDLQAMADAFEAKRKDGRAQLHSSGFGGSGFKFDATEDNAVKAYKKSLVNQMRKAEGEEVEDESDAEGDDEIREVLGGKNAVQTAQPAAVGGAGLPPPPSAAQAQAALLAKQQQEAAYAAAGGVAGAAMPALAGQLGITDEQLSAMPPEVQARVKAAKELAARLTSGTLQPGMVMAQPAAAAAAPWRPGMPLPSSAFASVQPASAFASVQPAVQPAPPPGNPPAPVNPILAAAQAAARRLAQEAGMVSGYMPAQQQAQQAAQQAAQQQAAQQLLQQMQAPGQPAGQYTMPGGMPGGMAGMPGQLQIPSSLAAMMLPPGGMPAGGMQMPGGVPGTMPGGLPGAVPGGAAANPSAVAPQPSKHYETELEINDFPQHARWKITHRETIRDMGELGAAVVVKGKYYKLGTAPGPTDERKLYLHIEGHTPDVVRRAKQEIKKIIEEYTEKAMRREGPLTGKYSVM